MNLRALLAFDIGHGQEAVEEDSDFEQATFKIFLTSSNLALETFKFFLVTLGESTTLLLDVLRIISRKFLQVFNLVSEPVHDLSCVVEIQSLARPLAECVVLFEFQFESDALAPKNRKTHREISQ